MKKLNLATLFSVLMVLVMVLSACAPAATPVPADVPAAEEPAAEEPAAEEPAAEEPAAEEPAAEEPAAPGGVMVAPANEFPIVSEPITLKILLVQTTGVSDYEVNEFTQWVEEKTNINLDFDVAPMAQSENRQKLNLVLASGQLPDIIMGFGIPLDQQQTLADQGLILPLDDLIDEYGYEFKEVIKMYPQTKSTFSLADGKMYSMPHINDCYHCQHSQKAWIYQPWLDALNLEVPTTTDELYTVLKAFKEDDPNGNGIQDEIPWSGAQTGSWHAALDQFIMNAFVYNSGMSSVQHMYVEDGKIKMAYAEPGWKEGILYLNKLYNEGLIDPEVFTNDMTKHKGLGEYPDSAVMGFTQAGWPGMFIDWNAGASNRWQEYVPVAPLKGPTGLQQSPSAPYGFGGTGAAMITKDCENPEAAFRLIDLFYSYESTMRSVYGRPGIEWEEADPTSESITGEGSPRYNVLVAWSEQEQAITWQQAAPTFRSTQFRLEWQQYNPADPLERLLYQWSRDLYAPYSKPEMEVPPLIFTSDQSKELGTLSAALTSYSDQMYAAFVTGQADVNTGWDQYLEDLNNNGLTRFLEIYQEVYDAKVK